MPEQKISLHGTDVIISFRGSDVTRSDNLYCVLSHLNLTYENYTLWLVEADHYPKFDWGRANDPKIRHLFVHDTGPFPKAMLYNLAVRASNAEILCFHDADSIGNPPTMAHCLQTMLTQGEADALQPFLNTYDIRGRQRDEILRNPTYDPLAEKMDDDDINLLYTCNPGSITWFRRATYCLIGGYNPAFTGWGGEDNELLLRARRLNRSWNSFHAPLIHLNHGPIERNTQIQALREHRNAELEAATANMPEPDFQALVSSLAGYFKNSKDMAEAPRS